MQEDLDKTTGMEGMSIEEMFLKSQESYQEAQQRALEENKAFARTEFSAWTSSGCTVYASFRSHPMLTAVRHDRAMNFPYISYCLS